MRERVLGFIQALRVRDVDVSVAETLDAVQAVAAAGVEREVLREALAASVVKDEGDRPTFDVLFEEMFPAVSAGAEEGARRRRRRGPGGGAMPTGTGRGKGDGSVSGIVGEREPSPRAEGEQPAASVRATARTREATTREAEPGQRRGRLAAMRRLLALPFLDFTPRDVEEARDLVQELGRRLRGRLARRERVARRGRLDVRRTIRASIGTGGVPLRPRFRVRRPGRPDLVALCDLSGSVAAASELLLGLLAPAGAYFRRTHLFAYVDHLVPVSIERGYVAPAGPIDLYARSDFGRVLQDLVGEEGLLTRATVLLVLGDARNNRLPPRAALLRAIRDRVQRVVWLVPEPHVRWDTGDSVLRLYAPACEAVLECTDLAALVRAVRHVF
jgi:hypothetical protein